MKIKILILEDDPLVSACLQQMLEGHNLLVAETVADAYRLFLANFDILAIISDYQVSEGTGLQFHA